MPEPSADLQTALDQLRDNLPRYKKYEDYYEGRHRLAFASEAFRTTFGTLFKEFADNLCPAVVDAVADRLTVRSFETKAAQQEKLKQKRDRAERRRQIMQAEAQTRASAIAQADPEAGPIAPQIPPSDELVDPLPPSPSQKAAEAAKRVWEDNRMDLQAGQVHKEALTTGDAYVLVWPDKEGVARIYPQKAKQVTVVYDDEIPGKIIYAAKVWAVSGRRLRLNLYYDDRIEKYISKPRTDNTLPDKASAFESYTPPDEEGPVLEHAWGRVPIFHFANNASIGECGVSELHNATPLQDALNKSVLDMMVGMEFASLPQRWATGLEQQIDPATGIARKPFRPGIDRIWAIGNEQARFGQFDPAPLGDFLQVQDSFRMEMARVTGTPLHYLMLISGTPPSGEALKTLEGRLSKKCVDRQVGYGNVWEDVVSFAAQMNGDVSDDPGYASVWESAETSSEKDKAETVLTKKTIGVPKRQCFEELGYEDDLIDQMIEEGDQERAMTAENSLVAFDRGGSFATGNSPGSGAVRGTQTGSRAAGGGGSSPGTAGGS